MTIYCVRDWRYNDHPNYFFGKEGEKGLIKYTSGKTAKGKPIKKVWGSFAADYDHKERYIMLHTIYRHPGTKHGMCKELFDHWWRYNIYLQPKAGLLDFYVALGFTPYQGSDERFIGWMQRKRLPFSPKITLAEHRAKVRKQVNAWRKKFPEKWAAQQKKHHRARSTEEGKQKLRDYYQANKEQMIAYNVKRHREHPEAQRRATAKYVSKNGDKICKNNRKARAKFLLKTETSKTRRKILKYVAEHGCYMDEAVVMLNTRSK